MERKVNHERNAAIDFHLKQLAIINIHFLIEEGADIAFLLPTEVRKK